MAPHAHAHSSVTLVLAGQIVESVGGREEMAGPLSVVVKPAGVIHSDTFGARGARTLQIAIQEAAQPAARWMEGWKWHHARLGVPEFVSLARHLNDGVPVTPASIETRVWEVFGALSGAEGAPRKSTPPRWLLRVREALDDQPAGAIEVRALARLAGVHPVSLTRAFKRHFGETVTRYRLRARLRQAALLLARESSSVSSVAHAAGFSDHSHFCREFRKATGVTPSAYRRLAGRR